MDFISIHDILTMLVNLVYGWACPLLGLVETLVFQMHLDSFGCFVCLHFILVLKWMNECWNHGQLTSSIWRKPRHWLDFKWTKTNKNLLQNFWTKKNNKYDWFSRVNDFQDTSKLWKLVVKGLNRFEIRLGIFQLVGLIWFDQFILGSLVFNLCSSQYLANSY